MDTAAPSGKFWSPIPSAKAIAPASAPASGLLANAPNATPTAKPSSNAEAAEKQSDEKQVNSEGDDKLDDLKKTFDDLNTEPKASTEPKPEVSDERDLDSFDTEKNKE